MGWVSKKIQAQIEQEIQTDDYWIEKAKLDFAMDLYRTCKAADINGKSLAEKLGKSAAYISKTFKGDANLTIESMVKLARAAGTNIEIRFDDSAVDKEQDSVIHKSANVLNPPHGFWGERIHKHGSQNAGSWIKTARDFQTSKVITQEASA